MLRWLLVGDVVTSELAAVLAYGSLRTARRRLARLVELGLLRGFWAANNQRPRGRYAYTLVSSVRAAFEQRSGTRPVRRRQDGAATTTIHRLATNDLLAAFLHAARPTEGLGIVAWLPERAVASLFDGYVLPDALAVVATGEARICLFIERDLGTESARTVAAKAGRYATILGSVDTPINVGIVVETHRRAASVREALTLRPTTSVGLWIGVTAELMADPYLARWTSPDGRRLATIEVPGEAAGGAPVVGVRCLLEPDGVDQFEPFAAREVRALRNYVREPEGDP